ncbi:MAG: hypothetical protein EOM24_35590, partial [Chloroflexia bacterium]|nr:hypothetical protein [Chloroflexia bacterium]
MTPKQPDQSTEDPLGNPQHPANVGAQTPAREQGEEATDWQVWQHHLSDLARQVGEVGHQTLTQMQDQIERISAANVRLAVTGLSGSGKTVFTLALVHLLKYSRHRSQLLDALRIREVVSVQIENSPALDIARFPYESGIAALSEARPQWPESTRNVSEIRIKLRYRPAQRSFFSLGDGVQQLTLDLVDYPGEWLMDLPLLHKSFAEWSQQSLALMATPPRSS